MPPAEDAASAAEEPRVKLPGDDSRRLRQQKQELRTCLKDLKKQEKKTRRREVALNRKAAKVTLQELAQIAVIKAQQDLKSRGPSCKASRSAAASSKERPRSLVEAALFLNQSREETQEDKR